jgi:hypothetical protein
VDSYIVLLKIGQFSEICDVKRNSQFPSPKFDPGTSGMWNRSTDRSAALFGRNHIRLGEISGLNLVH